LQESYWEISILKRVMDCSEKEFQKYINFGGNKTDVALELAQSMLLSRHYEKLVKNYGYDLFQEPEDKAAMATYLGKAYLALGKYEQARNNFEQALLFKRDYSAAELGLAFISISKQKWKVAETQLKNLTESYPEYRDAWAAQAGLYRSQNRLDEAIVSYKKAIEHDDPMVPGVKSFSIQIGLIQTLLANGNTEDAEEYINIISNIYPELPLTIYYQGLMAYLKKEYEQASIKLYDVTRLIPDYMPPYMLLGAIHYMNGNYEQANVLLKRYVRSVPSNTEARELLASVHVKLNQNKEAFDVLAPVLSSGISDERVLGLLGEIAARDNSGDQAIRTLMQAAKENPENAAIGNTLALAYIRNAKYDEALSSLRLLGESADTKSIVLQIQAYLHKSDLPNARKLARSLYDQSVDKSVADTVNGIVEIHAGQTNEASKFFKSAAKISSSNIMPRFHLARIALSNGRYEEARGYFEQVITIQDSYVPAYIGMAQLEQQQGNAEEALKWLKQAVAMGKDDISPTLILANYYITKKDANNANQVLMASQTQYPENENRDILIARTYQLSGVTDATIKYYKELLGKYPGSSQVYIEFAAFLSKIKQPDKARYYLTQAVKINPDSLRLQSALGLVTLQEGNVDQALEIAKKIQADDRDSSVGFVLAGDIYMSKSRYKEAKKNYLEAQKRKQTRKTLYKLFTVYNALGERSEGRLLVVSWLKAHPNDSAVRFNYANLMLSSKEWEKAISQYLIILKQSPDHVASLNNMALAYLQVDQEKALVYAKQAYELNKTSAALQDTLGWVYFKLGDQEKALLLLEKAISQSRHPSIQFHLASVYAGTGDRDKARKMLDTILKSDQYFEERKQAEELLKRLS